MLYGNISFTARTDAHVDTRAHARTNAHSRCAYENESVPNILISHLRGPNETA